MNSSFEITFILSEILIIIFYAINTKFGEGSTYP